MNKDPRLKATLMNCPLTSLRKPGAAMDAELRRLRRLLDAEKQQQRQQKRKLRRLERRCRVKPEDLAQPLIEEPVVMDMSSQTVRRMQTSAKTFFCQLKEHDPHNF